MLEVIHMHLDKAAASTKARFKGRPKPLREAQTLAQGAGRGREDGYRNAQDRFWLPPEPSHLMTATRRIEPDTRRLKYKKRRAADF
jgi:hypothetical protein